MRTAPYNAGTKAAAEAKAAAGGKPWADVSEEEEEILEAFWGFDDNGNGFIGIHDLRTIMTTMGDTLTDDEFMEMIEAVPRNSNGEINYVDYVHMMIFS